MKSFEALIQEAESANFSGWDFSWLKDRMVETALPWDYRAMVLSFLPQVDSLLDMATGGGEILSSFPDLPKTTYATENYPPNISVAEQTLGPLGIEVRQMGAAGELPFDDTSFDLVINRHSYFYAAELYRVLKPGGYFITQKVGADNHIDLNRFLAPDVLPIYSSEKYRFAHYVETFRNSGLEIIRAESAAVPAYFYDIGAVVYYLNVIQWQIPGFSVDKYKERLRKLDSWIREQERFVSFCERYLFVIQKPAL